MRSVVVVVVSLLLAGCGSAVGSGTDGPRTTEAGQASPTSARCPDAATWDGSGFVSDDQEPAPLPDDVTPAGILRCSVEWQDIEGEGAWLVLVGSWADSHLDQFAAELRKPDQALTDAACPAMYIPTPWFQLVTVEGEVLRAAVPRGVCGQPRQAALEALAALPFTTVSETRVRQVETAEAQASRCPQHWKDMVAIDAADASAKRSAEAPVLAGGPAPTKVRACLYASDGTPPELTPAGDFVSGRTLKGAALRDAFADLESAPAADPCSTRATTFAVLMTGNSVLTVETDGCGRMLTEAGELRAAPAALLAALQ